MATTIAEKIPLQSNIDSKGSKQKTENFWM